MALVLTRAAAICPHGLLACFLSWVPGGAGCQYSCTRKDLCLGRGEQEGGGKRTLFEEWDWFRFYIRCAKWEGSEWSLVQFRSVPEMYWKCCSKVIQVNRGYSYLMWEVFHDTGFEWNTSPKVFWLLYYLSVFQPVFRPSACKQKCQKSTI